MSRGRTEEHEEDKGVRGYGSATSSVGPSMKNARGYPSTSVAGCMRR